jgi:hypothetical protein
MNHAKAYEAHLHRTIDRDLSRWDAWVDFRTEIAEAIFEIVKDWALDPDSFALWNLSEDARSLPYVTAKICDLVNELDEYGHVEGVKAVTDRLIDVLDKHFGVSESFWCRTRNPQPHEIYPHR